MRKYEENENRMGKSLFFTRDEKKIGGDKVFYSLLNTHGKKAVMFTLTYEKEHLKLLLHEDE